MVSSAQSRPIYQAGVSGSNESHFSSVSWGAVIAGAFVASALSLILLALGTGIGLSALSPWSGAGASASTMSKAAVCWLIVVQIIASGLGGYLAGRLRTKWVDVHTHEVYFRDTAHGFLVWCVGLVITAAFLASAAASMVGSVPAAGSMAQGRPDPNAYFVDSFFRSDTPNATPVDASVRGEAGLIMAKGLRDGDVSSADMMYLAQLVAAKTGMSQPDTERRVSEIVSEARQAADNARRAAAHSLYWTFIALLIGAFFASYAATIGGRQRDHVLV